MLLSLKAGFEQEQANIEGGEVRANTSRASSASTTKRNAMNARQFAGPFSVFDKNGNPKPYQIISARVPQQQVETNSFRGSFQMKLDEEKKTPRVAERLEDSLLEVGNSSFFRALGTSQSPTNSQMLSSKRNSSNIHATHQ